MTELAALDGEAPEEISDESQEARERIRNLIISIEDNLWELADRLAHVHSNALYTSWGFASWKDYVAEELDFELRKSQYLVQLAQWKSKLSPKNRTWAEGLGATKAQEVMKYVNNENAAEWKKKLKDKSVRDIQEMLRSHKEEEAGAEDESEGSGAPKKEDRSSKITFTLFEEQVSNVETALKKAGEIAESDKKGHCLDMICVEYLAANAGTTSIDEYLKNVEATTGYAIVAFSNKNGERKVVYGGNHLDEIEDS